MCNVHHVLSYNKGEQEGIPLRTISVHHPVQAVHMLRKLGQVEPNDGKTMGAITDEDNPYNGRDTKYRIMIYILPLILQKMIMLV